MTTTCFYRLMNKCAPIMPHVSCSRWPAIDSASDTDGGWMAHPLSFFAPPKHEPRFSRHSVILACCVRNHCAVFEGTTQRTVLTSAFRGVVTRSLRFACYFVVPCHQSWATRNLELFHLLYSVFELSFSWVIGHGRQQKKPTLSTVTAQPN